MIDTDTVIEREEDLQGYFEPGSKPADLWGLGVEYERFGVLRDTGAPVPYEGPRSVEKVLATLVRERGWEPDEEGGRLLGARRGPTRITLEPGAQLEMSGGVHRTLAGVRQELAWFLSEVEAASRPLGIAWLGVGMQPFAPLDRIPWIPKTRYAIMRDYLPTRGTRGHVMMKQTACIQSNLDYASESDALEKMRAAMGVSPLVTAAFARSPLAEGRVNGFMSARAWAWRDTDPDRCGLLPFVFRDGAGFGDYLDWALDVPLFFVVRDDTYHPAPGLTFRRFIRDGFRGGRPTLADFELHLTTLFPEVRLKRYIELRGADSGDPLACLSQAALWKGLLYDAPARRAAWDLVRDMTFEERNALLDAVCRMGPEAPLPQRLYGRRTARDLALEVVALARRGLETQGHPEDGAWLRPLERTLQDPTGCPARALLDSWEGAMGRDPRRLIETLAASTIEEA